MATMDFKLIRATPKSRNDSFEALAVQLFKAVFPESDKAEFHSLRGDGGDGGVEAYFETEEGEIGVQAKYFFKLGSSELTQISSSLKTARKNYPTLIAYHIYIPFDLTGRTGRGEGETERFSKWKSKVEQAAKDEGFDLTVTLISASEIRNQILEVDTHGGLRRYWFNDAILSRKQIEAGLDQAEAYAGPRYTASIDVVTEAHEALDHFGGVGDFSEWMNMKLKPLRIALNRLVRDADNYYNQLSDTEKEQAKTLLSSVYDQIIACKDLENFQKNSKILKGTISSLKPLTEKAEQLKFNEFIEKHGEGSDTPGFRQFQAEYMCAFPASDLDNAREAINILDKISSFLEAPLLLSSISRSLLLVGPAGIGKTHALVSAAKRRLNLGGYSLIVFGDDFRGYEPWEVLRTKLGLGSDIGRDELFECLSACGKNTDLPFVIFIDALNESPREARWKQKLPELLEQLRPYENIRVCVSTRDTYRDLVLDARFPGYAFEHQGFHGHEHEALEAFCNAYELNAEITPLFTNEFANPLFLHLTCKTLKAKGKSSLDVLLPGSTEIFEDFLTISDNVIRSRLGYINPTNLIRRAMILLIGMHPKEGAPGIYWEDAIREISPILNGEVKAPIFIDEMHKEGLIIISSDKADETYIRFGYQRFGDILRALNLIEDANSGDGSVDYDLLKSRITINHDEVEGLLEALSAVLPEKLQIEIIDERLELDKEKSYALLIKSLAWRSLSSISSYTIYHIKIGLGISGLWLDIYNAVLTISLVPNHPLNAEWFHDLLMQQELTLRDPYLSYCLYHSYDDSGVVKTIIDASLKTNMKLWPEESRNLNLILLSWFCSCSDRRIRDLSAKGMVRVLSEYPELSTRLAETFKECDDDYILESITLSIYSACLLRPKESINFGPAIEILLDANIDSKNILIRDNIRLTIDLIDGSGELLSGLSEKLLHFPSKASLPEPWPGKKDVEPMLVLEGLPSNMNLIVEKMQPDFWRYIVQPKLRYFDLSSLEIKQENLAAWIMLETLNLGYPGRGNRALEYDRSINSEFGFGRGRKGYAERLGKKYYWISLHRLFGLLSDNVPPNANYDEKIPTANYYWSNLVRKTDLTDVRDISPKQTYPEVHKDINHYPFGKYVSDNKVWVKQETTDHIPGILNEDIDHNTWACLSYSCTSNDKDEESMDFNQEYRYVHVYIQSVLVANTYSLDANVHKYFENQGNSTYHSYIAEYPQSDFFDQCIAYGNVCLDIEDAKCSEITLLRGSNWEYDYSNLSESHNIDAPCPALIMHHNLTWDRQDGWLDCEGNLAAFYLNAEGYTGLYYRKDLLDKYLTDNDEVLLFRQFENRGCYAPSNTEPSIDVITYLKYVANIGFINLKVEKVPFNI